MARKNFTVAIVQAAGPLFDLGRGLAMLEKFAKKAAQAGAQFVLFPEAFIGGYPRGLSFGTVVGERSEQGRELWLKYAESCPLEDGPEIDQLKSIASEFGLYLGVGLIERARLGGSLFCSILYFSPQGQLLGKHRKLRPTAAERVIWSDAQPQDSLSVVETNFGKVGGLICWENYMPLARMAIYQQGVEIYVAPTADQRDRWQNSMIHVALEGRCFVISANQFVTRVSIPLNVRQEFPELHGLPDTICRGGSMIVDPMGNILTGPVWDQETLIVQTIDLDEVLKAKMDFDVIGHYDRKDVFQFSVQQKKAD